MNKPTQSEIEVLAMEMWQTATGETYGWGSVPETLKYRDLARKKLTEGNDDTRE